LFLLFLTLAGWDIGAGGASSEVDSIRNVARVCALWTLAAGAAVIFVRVLVYKHRWFILTGAALLHVALHGLAGVSYLLSGVISLVLAIFIIATARLFRRRPNPGEAS
jgi:hypothetical protein